MTAHEHTSSCAHMSRYVLVRCSVVVNRDGTADVTVSMKPGGRCWAEVEPVAAVRRVPVGLYPSSPEEAAEVSVYALRKAFAGLF